MFNDTKDGPSTWTVLKFKWVNGVPGCGKSGKTSWIVEHFDPMNDMILTTTTEARRDVQAVLKCASSSCTVDKCGL